MYIDDGFQLNILMMSVGMGAVIAVVYDIFKVLHKLLFKTYHGVILKDVLFCFTSSLLWFLFLVAVNFGRMRVYLFVGAVGGFCCWYYSFSTIFVSLIFLIFRNIKKFFILLGRLISLPFRPFYKLINIFVRKLSDYLKKYFTKLKNKSKIDLKNN